MEIVILSPGNKPKDPELGLINSYSKKVSRSIKLSHEYLNVKSKTSDKAKAMVNEAEQIKKYIQVDDFVIALDESGKKMGNLEFAKLTNRIISGGNYSRIVLIIGGPFGLEADIKDSANLIWSFSDQVFPYNLFNLMLTEQIYRTFEILAGTPYHHV